MNALTDREMQVLRGIRYGRSNREIGETLGISEDTVKTHVRRLLRKLGVNDRTAAVSAGFESGLLLVNGRHALAERGPIRSATHSAACWAARASCPTCRTEVEL